LEWSVVVRIACFELLSRNETQASVRSSGKYGKPFLSKRRNHGRNAERQRFCGFSFVNHAGSLSGNVTQSVMD
jgi:hypothetical protein